ncbi:hypothetical protein BGX30_007636, partial [Mortierella sp. GBA39]
MLQTADTSTVTTTAITIPGGDALDGGTPRRSVRRLLTVIAAQAQCNESLVITDTFEKEGIADLHDDIEHEIASKQDYLRQDLESQGRQRYFLIAWMEGKIAGTI